MPNPLILVALAAGVVLIILAVRLWRARSDERIRWQATRQRDWTVDELDALSTRDTGEVPVVTDGTPDSEVTVPLPR